MEKAVQMIGRGGGDPEVSMMASCSDVGQKHLHKGFLFQLLHARLGGGGGGGNQFFFVKNKMPCFIE